MKRRKRNKNKIREIINEIGGVTTAARIGRTTRATLYTSIRLGRIRSAAVAVRLLQAADRSLIELAGLMVDDNEIEGGNDGRCSDQI